MIALGRDSRDTSLVVIYKNIETDRIWVRQASEWDEEVTRPEHNYNGPRFKKCKPSNPDYGPGCN